MSLTVGTYTLTPEGKMAGIYPPIVQFWREPGFKDLTSEQQLQRWREVNPNPGKDMAGPENYRWKLWGSEAVLSLGCTLLPTLRTTDIYATGEQLDQLACEVELLQANIGLVYRLADSDVNSVEHYLQNMAEAIARARAINGGVVIW